MARGRSKRERRIEQQRRDRARRAEAKHAVLSGSIENNQCVLTLGIAHPARTFAQKQIRAIIDTGATNSTIHPDIAKELGLPVVDKIICVGVHGAKESPVVVLKMFVKDKDKEATKTIPAIVPDGQTDQMLFGMDAMAGGVLTVDTNNGSWEWRLTKINVIAPSS